MLRETNEETKCNEFVHFISVFYCSLAIWDSSHLMMLGCITGFQVTFDSGVVVFFKSGGLPPSTQGTGLCFKWALSLSAGHGFTCNASLSLLDSGVLQPAGSAVFIST